MKDKKNKSAYEELWEYIVSFQTIPFFLQQTIHIILNKNWLKNDFWTKEKENIIGRIILAENNFHQLLSIYNSLIKELYWAESNDFKIIDKLTSFIRDYIENKRNDIIHSFMFVDKNNTENLIICREKFQREKWFKVLWNEEIKKDLLEKQIKIINDVCTKLIHIYRNLEKNNKIDWNFSISKDWKKAEIEISLKEINSFIKNCKTIIKQ